MKLWNGWDELALMPIRAGILCLLLKAFGLAIPWFFILWIGIIVPFIATPFILFLKKDN